MATVSKAQQFYLAAEACEGWEVKRSKIGEKRTVIVSRGPESFQFQWAPNETTGRVTFLEGFHRVNQELEPYSNVKEALRIMKQPPGSVTIEPKRERKMKSSTPKADVLPITSRLKVSRLPFDPSTTPDDELIEVVSGKRIEWSNRVNPDVTEIGRVPERSPHTRISRDPKDDSPEARILHFYSHDGSPSQHNGHKYTEGRYVAVQISSIRRVHV